MTLTDEIKQVRPDCDYCNVRDSALTFWGGKLCCGECLGKMFHYQQEQSKLILQGVINSKRKI